MANANDASAASATIVHPVLKFFIGFFGGICAAFIPRLGGMLTTDTSRLTILPIEFVVSGFLFGALIGGVMVILEYGMPKAPKETFVAALGVPALIAGALNTASNTSELKDVARQKSALVQALGQQVDIPTLQPEEILRPLQGAVAPPDRTSGWGGWVPGVTNVYAADSPSIGQSATSFNTAIQVRQPQYVIVLDQAQTKDQAITRAAELRKQVPQAQAVQSGQGYLIIQGGAPKSETAALLDAVKLKNETKLQPKLLPIK